MLVLRSSTKPNLWSAPCLPYSSDPKLICLQKQSPLLDDTTTCKQRVWRPGSSRAHQETQPDVPSGVSVDVSTSAFASCSIGPEIDSGARRGWYTPLVPSSWFSYFFTVNLMSDSSHIEALFAGSTHGGVSD
jgi:hypothetical protein